MIYAVYALMFSKKHVIIISYLKNKLGYLSFTVCDRTFDIVLAIDGTGNEKDFGYLKGAIVQLLDRLIMGERKVKVGVVLLGNNDGIQIPISGNRSELEDQIARLGLPDDSNRYDIGKYKTI
jgi:hypothetical protein